MGVKLLGKIKIHEIAKEIGVTSKEVIQIANDLEINVTSHLSAVGEDEANTIKSKLKGNQSTGSNKENNAIKTEKGNKSSSKEEN